MFASVFGINVSEFVQKFICRLWYSFMTFVTGLYSEVEIWGGKKWWPCSPTSVGRT